MAEQTDDKFTFTWIIENFSMCHLPKGQFFESLSFVIHSVPSIKWCIELYPNGYRNENYIAVYLRRDDDSVGVCNIKYSIQGLDSNEKVIFSCLEKDAAVFETKMSRGYYDAAKREPLCHSLINDILIIKCVMEPAFETKEQEIFASIPYKNGLFTDIILRAGDTIYKLHKAVLSARWPKLLEKLDAEKSSELALDIKSEVLEAMIEYVYTGKLDCSKPKILGDLYAAATRYELLNLQSTPIVALKVRTQFNIKKISFHWPIENFTTLAKDTVLYSHVFSVSLPNPCRWYLILHLRENAIANTSFHISICKVRNTEPKPVFVKSKIAFNEQNSSENKHFFPDNESWKCAEFSENISINPQDVLLLECEFIFSDCKYFSEITESFCAFTTSINCHNFSSDLRNLYETGQFSDARITVGSEVFFVHKCILCARSSVFSRMFQTKMTEAKNDTIEISDVDPNVMEKMLSYMYSGYLEDMEDSVEELYSLANRYDVPSLRKKCSNFLKSNFTFGNVCNILQLADLHSDSDLFNSALDFISDHAKDVFSTDHWIKITKCNFMAKLLQDLVLKIK
ncbi:Speckle-type POZ protein B, partial [Stegodyphus mimosarum]